MNAMGVMGASNPAMGGIPVVDPMANVGNFAGIATEAAEDMPF